MLPLYASLAVAAREREREGGSMAREKQVNIRLSLEEYARILAEAEKVCMPIGTFMRTVALRRRFKLPPPKMDVAAWLELGRIGSNLNQIAFKLNAGFGLDVEELRKELVRLNRVLELIRTKLLS